MKNKLINLLLITILALNGCGSGGGGGSEFIGAAIVDIEASPQSIDTSDRTRVTVRVSEVHSDGIVLKIRFPLGLDYVSGSALLKVDDQEESLNPDFIVSNDDHSFLIFLLDPDLFGEDLEGNLEFELVGTELVDEGRIEADADVKTDDFTFNPEEPGFTAEDGISIEVAS